jgi:hypothetical protein
MRRWGLTFLILAGVAVLAAGCDDDDWGSTRLIVINNTGDTVLVEVDEHEDGDIDVSATMGPSSQVSWVLDAGWAVVFVDGDGTEIFLSEDYDGVFEIADQ